MTDQILEELREMRSTMTANHVEVVQRLTALETRVEESPIKELEHRIKSLEGWRNKIAGFTVAANLLIMGAYEWTRAHVK